MTKLSKLQREEAVILLDQLRHTEEARTNANKKGWLVVLTLMEEEGNESVDVSLEMSAAKSILGARAKQIEEKLAALGIQIG